IKHFLQAVRARCDVRQNQSSLGSVHVAPSDFETVEVRGIEESVIEAVDGGPRRPEAIQAAEKFVNGIPRTLRLDADAFGRIRDPARQVKLCGKPIYMGPITYALNGASNDNANTCQSRHDASPVDYPDERDSIQASMPAPVLAETSNTCI